jgi:hypothetical protein
MSLSINRAVKTLAADDDDINAINPDYSQKIEDDFRELFTARLKENENFGIELWSAMANVDWYHKDDPDKFDRGYSFRAAGSLIASMLDSGCYLDWYCSGPISSVSEYIAEKMASKGWCYKTSSQKYGL